MGWSCPKLPHVALSLECGGLICSGWEGERRMAPWALDVARRWGGVSLPSSARGLLSSLFVSSLFVSFSYYPAFFLAEPGRGIYFRCSLLTSCCLYCSFGYPSNYIIWEAGHGGPRGLCYA